MSNLHTNEAGHAAKPRRRNARLAVLAALMVGVAIGLFVVAGLVVPPSGDVGPETLSASLDDATSRQRTAPMRAKRGAGSESSEARAALVEDDGQTLWASPTDGAGLDLAYLPPGAQVIVSVRPRALARHAEGEKIRAAVGPLGKLAIQYVEQAAGVPWPQIERLLAGFQITSQGKWQTTLVIEVAEPALAAAKSALASVAPRQHAGQSYWLDGGRAHYFPVRKDRHLRVVAPAESIEEILELAGEAPPLRRDLRRLLAHTDADRHVTIVGAPNSLFSDGRAVFDGPAAPLREPLFWFLGDEFSAAGLSLHWGEAFFLELAATPTLETLPERAARILADRAEEVPERLAEHVAKLQATPHGRQLVSRLPEMVRTLNRYARRGFDADHVVLRGYLPATAGHNLLMAAELAVAESASIAGAASGTRQSAAGEEESLEARLERPSSLCFARDTLEAALEQLSQDIGVEIVIRGADLQAEGITKNQSFGMDLENRPAGEILVEILRLANPDKSAAGPADPRQRLVYVVAATEEGRAKHIVVTTRTAATARGDELPGIFVAGRP